MLLLFKSSHPSCHLVIPLITRNSAKLHMEFVLYCQSPFFCIGYIILIHLALASSISYTKEPLGHQEESHQLLHVTSLGN